MRELIENLLWITTANTARWKQEPIHKNTLAIIVWIIGEQSMPFIFLFTATITATTTGLHFAILNSKKCKHYK